MNLPTMGVRAIPNPKKSTICSISIKFMAQFRTRCHYARIAGGQLINDGPIRANLVLTGKVTRPALEECAGPQPSSPFLRTPPSREDGPSSDPRFLTHGLLTNPPPLGIFVPNAAQRSSAALLPDAGDCVICCHSGAGA